MASRRHLQLPGRDAGQHTFNQDTTNVGGANRGNVIGDINLPKSQRTIDRWFNTDAIGPGGAGAIDNAGRNLIWGPGTRAVDFSLSRKFDLPWEGDYVQSASSRSTSPTRRCSAGRTRQSAARRPAAFVTAGEPRRIQFGLKFIF